MLGRIAVREGHIKEADRYLLAAGKSPGSPQMDSFGPNMSLAKDLLEKGQRNTVLQYFALCHKFWKSESGIIQRGLVPAMRIYLRVSQQLLTDGTQPLGIVIYQA